MKIRPALSRHVFGLLCLSGIILVGCNMPVAGRYPDSISDENLRQTIAAQLDATMIASDIPPASTQEYPSSTPVPFDTPISGNSSENAENPDYANPGAVYRYYARSGDTLKSLSQRFHVAPQQIISPVPIPEADMISPGQELVIPNINEAWLPSGLLLPDNELINSRSSIGFDIEAYLAGTGGFLNSYQESVNGQSLSGAQIIERVSIEASINPKVLLAFLEYRSGWVRSQTVSSDSLEHPVGFRVPGYQGLYLEMVLTGTHLNAGYYGWRDGTLRYLKFSDGSQSQPHPTINAGTAAVQNLFAKFYRQVSWKENLYASDGFRQLYTDMFGDPWSQGNQTDPIFPPGIVQPGLELPFSPGERWSLTGGPHYSWNTGSPRGALDFAPVTGEPACAVSRAWVLASASGRVVRSAQNVVVIDLDGDGHEQTGWNIVYVHIAEQDSIGMGEYVDLDQSIGHPSCERGRATGTHVHIARKYNGEWLFADERLPFNLSGWQVVVGSNNYQGQLIRDGQTVSASPSGNASTSITR